MISIIVLLILVHEAIKIHKARQCTKQSKTPALSEKELNRIQRAKEKAIKQAEKERQQAQKAEQKKQQAEADKIFIENQLNQLNKMLIQADKELSEIELEIKKCYALRSYNKISNLEKQKPLIIKRIMTLENRVHTAEARLAKANYIIKAG